MGWGGFTGPLVVLKWELMENRRCNKTILLYYQEKGKLQDAPVTLFGKRGQRGGRRRGNELDPIINGFELSFQPFHQ